MILKKIYIPALAPGGQGRDINTKCSIVPIGGQVPPTLLGTQRANFFRDQIVLSPYGPSRAFGDN